jgi:GNAT superfamily N-acetyltransferase
MKGALSCISPERHGVVLSFADLIDLERMCWAPWFRFEEKDFVLHRELFPQGQMTVVDREEQRVVAALSTGCVTWDGSLDSLPTRREVTGDPVAFRQVHDPRGNTIVLLSMSVDPTFRGRGLAESALTRIQGIAGQLGLEHVISDFRPGGYGICRERSGFCRIREYVARRREDGLLEDPWLRAVVRAGGRFLRLDPRAMVVPASGAMLEEYRSGYRPEEWNLVDDPEVIGHLIGFHRPYLDLAAIDEVLDCGEVGWWFVDRDADAAVYIEANVSGELPVTSTGRTGGGGDWADAWKVPCVPGGGPWSREDLRDAGGGPSTS